VLALYPAYRTEFAVGLAIVADVALSAEAPQPPPAEFTEDRGIAQPDFGAPGFGLFTPDYSNDTRSFMEQSASQAMIDYMAELKHSVDPDSVQVLNADTRGSLDTLYVAGTAKLSGNEEIFWLVRTTTTGDNRVIYIRSDEYGDFVIK
jgi:hypothetical protein